MAPQTSQQPSGEAGQLPRLTRWALQNRLLLALLVLLPIAALAFYALRITTQAVHHLVQQNNRIAARTAATMMSQELAVSRRLAETFASLPGMKQSVAAHDQQAVREILMVLLESQGDIDRAFVTDPDGVLWSDYPEAPELLNQDFSHQDWYQGVRQGWLPYVSRVYHRPAEPRSLVVAVATPIHHEGQVAGILVYQYRLATITGWMRAITLGEEGYVFLVDHTGNLVAHPQLDLGARLYEEYAGLALLQEALQGEQEVAEYADPLTGEKMVASFAPVAMAPGQYWVTVAQQPLSEAYASIRQLRLYLGIAAGVVAVLALASVSTMGAAQRWLQGANRKLEREIRERQRYEQQLRESEAFVDSIVENIPNMIFVKDAKDLRFVRLNKAGEELLGISRSEFIGMNDYDLFSKEEADHFVARDREVLGSRRMQEVQEETVETRNHGRRILHTKKVPLMGPDDEPAFLLGISEDITQRRQAEQELQATAEALRRSNQELEQFAYIASHDLQEPLRKVQGFGDMLKAQAGDALDAQSRDYLLRMQNAARRMQELVNGLLAYARVTTKAQPFEPVDLRKITEQVVADLEIRIRENKGRVEVGELPTVDADPLQMRQLLQNLIGNGLKFHRPGVPPMIRVYGRILDGDLCEVHVEDNGIGFEEKDLERIFKPFQRLHSRSSYEGTGIGLALVQKIAERHHGSVTASSIPGGGATFILTLPCRYTNKEDSHAT